MIGYSLSVLVGIVGAALASRWQGPQVALQASHQRMLFNAAVLGAIFGAYGFELPADLLGWGGPAPVGIALAGDSLPLGGRTVVGGLIGGWLAVEWAKRRAHITAPTGDGFALPLAVALTCGRFGCYLVGCCAGKVCDPGWWATRDAAGLPRFSTQLIEVAFHAIAALFLAIAVKKHLATGRRFAIYLTFYAVLRFALEFVRENKPLASGLTWYQWLCLLLLAMAGTTWWRRARPITLI